MEYCNSIHPDYRTMYGGEIPVMCQLKTGHKGACRAQGEVDRQWQYIHVVRLKLIKGE